MKNCPFENSNESILKTGEYNSYNRKKINLPALIQSNPRNFEDEVIMTKSSPLNVFIRIRNYNGSAGVIYIECTKRVTYTHKFGDNTNYIAERNGECLVG